jgi:hypothetical protein
MVVYTYNASNWEVEMGRGAIGGQLEAHEEAELYKATLSQKKKKKSKIKYKQKIEIRKEIEK